MWVTHVRVEWLEMCASAYVMCEDVSISILSIEFNILYWQLYYCVDKKKGLIIHENI